jgi:hypothetical protein
MRLTHKLSCLCANPICNEQLQASDIERHCGDLRLAHLQSAGEKISPSISVYLWLSLCVCAESVFILPSAWQLCCCRGLNADPQSLKAGAVCVSVSLSHSHRKNTKRCTLFYAPDDSLSLFRYFFQIRASVVKRCLGLIQCSPSEFRFSKYRARELRRIKCSLFELGRVAATATAVSPQQIQFQTFNGDKEL